MEKLYNTLKGSTVTFGDGVSGVICGYTDSHFILLLGEGITAEYAFSLDELGKENYFIDASFEENCEDCLYSYANENDIKCMKKDILTKR